MTLYGGAELRVNMDLDAGGILPFVGADLNMVVRGSVNTLVDPVADPC